MPAAVPPPSGLPEVSIKIVRSTFFKVDEVL
jgi:hypothetical protein